MFGYWVRLVDENQAITRGHGVRDLNAALNLCAKVAEQDARSHICRDGETVATITRMGAARDFYWRLD